MKKEDLKNIKQIELFLHGKWVLLKGTNDPNTRIELHDNVLIINRDVFYTYFTPKCSLIIFDKHQKQMHSHFNINQWREHK